jgi:hypothetical protein
MKKLKLILLLFFFTIQPTSCGSSNPKKQLTLEKQANVELLINKFAEKLRTLYKADVELTNKHREYAKQLKKAISDCAQIATKKLEYLEPWEKWPKKYQINLDCAETVRNGTVAKTFLPTLQKTLAYHEIVTNEIIKTSEALLALNGVSERLKLDIILLTNFNEDDFDKLIKQLDNVIVSVQPKAQELVFANENIKLPDIDTVWDNYVIK